MVFEYSLNKTPLAGRLVGIDVSVDAMPKEKVTSHQSFCQCIATFSFSIPLTRTSIRSQ